MPSADIRVLPADSLNLKIVNVTEAGSSPLCIALTPAPPIHHWFAATLTNLPLDQEIALRIIMHGNDMPGNKATVRKWIGLTPYFTYADPMREEAYEWFTRNAEGEWLSGDPCKFGDARRAGDGKTPLQMAIPQELAVEFLSPDGTYWMPWQRITTGEALLEENDFLFTHRFHAPTATIAMHIPYTHTYLLQFSHRLRAANLPGVSVDEIGVTREGRALQVIRIDDPEHPTPLRLDRITRDGASFISPWIDEPADGAQRDQRVILVTAREHGSEHPSSWPMHGMLRALTDGSPESRRLREKTTWLLAPIYDPDSSVNSRFHQLTSRFYNHFENETPREILAYARYLRAFVNSGRPIDIAAAFYGLECNEGEAVMSPFIQENELHNGLEFNTFWFDRLRAAGIYSGSPRPWDTGLMPMRISGWCADVYGALPLVFEINDQHPKGKLDLQGLDQVGQSFVSTLVDFLHTHAGAYRARETRKALIRRWTQMQTRYWRLPELPIREGLLPDLISMGY